MSASGLAPGWQSVSGAWEDSYRTVWAEVYELAPGGEVTSADLRDKLGMEHRSTVHRAMAVLEAAGLAEQHKGARVVVWVRRPLPEAGLSVAGLMARGVPGAQALSLLRGLESAGYLTRDERGVYRDRGA